MTEIMLAQTSEEYDEAKKLFQEYAKELGIDLEHQNFSHELLHIKEQYGNNNGGIFLIKINDEYIGCAGLRNFSKNVAELKRMYIREKFRGKGLGRILVKKLIELAQNLGYTEIRLDTLPTMQSAILLYKKMGFYEIDAYRYSPFEGTKYFELTI